MEKAQVTYTFEFACNDPWRIARDTKTLDLHVHELFGVWPKVFIKCLDDDGKDVTPRTLNMVWPEPKGKTCP